MTSNRSTADSTARLAVLILAFCCVGWGFSFPAMQIGAEAVRHTLQLRGVVISEVAMRGIFNGWRFTLAGLLSVLLAGNPARYRRNDWVGGLLVGLSFGVGMLLQLSGLRYTLPSISSFLTALTVILAPVAQALILRRTVGSRVWISVALATAGMLILCTGDADAAAGRLVVSPPIPYFGQILTVVAAIFFTAQILVLDHFGQSADPVRLTSVMLLTAGVVNLIVGFSTGGDALQRADIVRPLLHTGDFIWPFLGLALVSSLLTMQLMCAWQPKIAPATAAVVYALEPVFGTIFSIIFHTEILVKVTLAGGLVILLAVLIVARQPVAACAERQAGYSSTP
jgi:drug/metabolite transporter (DMT)-like permease